MKGNDSFAGQLYLLWTSRNQNKIKGVRKSPLDTEGYEMSWEDPLLGVIEEMGTFHLVCPEDESERMLNSEKIHSSASVSVPAYMQT